jgi:hypothetical protein
VIARLLSEHVGLPPSAPSPTPPVRLNKLSATPARPSGFQDDGMWGVLSSLSTLGRLAMDLGDFVAARRYLEESVEVAKQLNSERDIFVGWSNLGTLALVEGRYEDATKLFRWNLEYDDSHDDTEGVIVSVGNLGIAAVVGETPQEALGFLGSGSGCSGCTWPVHSAVSGASIVTWVRDTSGFRKHQMGETGSSGTEGSTRWASSPFPITSKTPGCISNRAFALSRKLAHADPSPRVSTTSGAWSLRKSTTTERDRCASKAAGWRARWAIRLGSNAPCGSFQTGTVLPDHS